MTSVWNSKIQNMYAELPITEAKGSHSYSLNLNLFYVRYDNTRNIITSSNLFYFLGEGER